MRGPSSPRERFAALGSLAPRLARAAWAGAATFGVGVIVTVIVVLSTSRLYRSEAVVVYERGVLAKTLAGDPESASSMATRVHDMLTSRQRLETTIRQMKLYRGVVERRGMGEAIDELHKHIQVTGREGYTYRVGYDGESRDAAKEVLERLLGSVVEEDRQRRAKEVEDTKRFLTTERGRADDDLKSRESELAAFLTKHPQLASEVGGGAASTGGLIRAADRDRAAAGNGDVGGLELQAAQLEESLAAATRAGPAPRVSVPSGIDPALLTARTRAETEAQLAHRELSDNQMRLTNEHPDVKQAVRRVQLAEAAVRQAEAAIAAWQPPAPAGGEAAEAAGADGGEGARVAALRHALAAVRQQISSVRGRAAPRVEVPTVTGAVVEIDTGWTRLNRLVAEARERQAQLEAKQFQTELAGTLIAGGQGGQLVVADPPFRPTRPVSGARSKFVVAGLVGALILAALIMALVAAIDDRLYAASDLESFLDDGIVVVVPGAPRRLPARSTSTTGTTSTTEGSGAGKGGGTAGATGSTSG